MRSALWRVSICSQWFATRRAADKKGDRALFLASPRGLRCHTICGMSVGKIPKKSKSSASSRLNTSCEVTNVLSDRAHVSCQATPKTNHFLSPFGLRALWANTLSFEVARETEVPERAAGDRGDNATRSSRACTCLARWLPYTARPDHREAANPRECARASPSAVDA